MSESVLTVYVTYLARAAGAVILTLLLFNFHLRYRKSYLRHWSWSWLSLALFYLASGSAFALSASFGPAHPWHLVASAVAGSAGYLQVGFLLVGCWELLTRRHARLRLVQWTTLLLAVLGVVPAFLFLQPADPPGLRVFARVGIYGLIAGAAFILAAVMVWRSRGMTPGFGLKLISSAFLLFGLEQVHYFVLTLVAWRSGGVFRYGIYLGFGDFLFLMLMGVGMVTTLLEDEREAAGLAMDEIEHLAYHDPLTGLPNRALFMDRLIVALAQAARSQQKVAVFLIDLDRFKEINESLGHASGDQVIRAVADRVARFVRTQDTFGRFGADEFGFLIQHLREVEDAARLAQKILEVLRAPITVAGQELFLTASVGISFFPSDGTRAELLVRNANTAMIRAKQCGGDCPRIYAADMNDRALEKLALENLLHKALANDELVLHYQPLVDLESEQVFGVEALLRWRHPYRGLLLPSEFISIAELSGLIVPIGDWVLQQACRDLRRLQENLGPDFLVSVNLSARQFQQPNVASRVRRAIESAGIRPASLEIEITETNAMQNAEATAETLRDLKKIGVSLSVDDFGTGYSSLDYLKRFPIDTLKLDQSFVRDLGDDSGDAAIATAVIAMAHSLGLRVTAEGVETERQLGVLRAEGCDRIQGHLFSAALDLESLERFLDDRSRLDLSPPVENQLGFER